MIDISTTATFDRLFDKLPKTDLFQTNPFHPSFHVEKLHPKHHEVWSFRIDRTYRVIFKFVRPDHAELHYIGHHHSIYDYDMFR